MPHFVDSSSKGFNALAALNMGTIVKLNASGQVVVTTSAADIAIGTLTESVTAGRTANVKLRNGSGTLPVLLGGTVAVGALLVSNGAGAAVAATQATAGTQPTSQVIGIAVEAGVAGSIIEAIGTDFVY